MRQPTRLTGLPVVTCTIIAVFALLDNTEGIELQVKYDNEIVTLTCIIQDAALPITFYNVEDILGRCWLIPKPECSSFLENGKFTSDSKGNQYTLLLWNLKSSICSWSCSHGGRNDDSSTVVIRGPNSPKFCQESSKPDKTSFWVLTTFLISFMVVWSIIFITQERKKIISSTGEIIKCNAKILIGIKVSVPCTLFVSIILVAFFLDNTIAQQIVGCCIAVLLGCSIPLILRWIGGTYDGTGPIPVNANGIMLTAYNKKSAA